MIPPAATAAIPSSAAWLAEERRDPIAEGERDKHLEHCRDAPEDESCREQPGQGPEREPPPAPGSTARWLRTRGAAARTRDRRDEAEGGQRGKDPDHGGEIAQRIGRSLLGEGTAHEQHESADADSAEADRYRTAPADAGTAGPVGKRGRERERNDTHRLHDAHGRERERDEVRGDGRAEGE